MFHENKSLNDAASSIVASGDLKTPNEIEYPRRSIIYAILCGAHCEFDEDVREQEISLVKGISGVVCCEDYNLQIHCKYNNDHYFSIDFSTHCVLCRFLCPHFAGKYQQESVLAAIAEVGGLE